MKRFLLIALVCFVAAGCKKAHEDSSAKPSGGGPFDVRGAFEDIVFPATVVNLALAPPIYFVMRLAKPRASRNRYAY